MMRVLDLIAFMDPAVLPGKTKVHLATWNGRDHPLDVYLAGKFDDWQQWQSRRNFEREFVISLIALSRPNRWLFAGVHQSHGSRWLEEHSAHYYTLVERPACSELNGRLIVEFRRPGRQSYLNAETWAEQMLLDSILPERIKFAEFPGYKAVDLAKHELDLIVAQGLDSWRTALSNVAGVYLISDTASGRLYVGSATGEGGIWGRWCQYSATGHGGNQELRNLLQESEMERPMAFRFSVLEIADTHTSVEQILQRESHWKRVLLSRDHGWNAN
jgi:hypothetical protein